jgi:hypothetical protein
VAYWATILRCRWETVKESLQLRAIRGASQVEITKQDGLTFSLRRLSKRPLAWFHEAGSHDYKQKDWTALPWHRTPQCSPALFDGTVIDRIGRRWPQEHALTVKLHGPPIHIRLGHQGSIEEHVIPEKMIFPAYRSPFLWQLAPPLGGDAKIGLNGGLIVRQIL